MPPNEHALAAEQLRLRTDPAEVGIDSTESAPPLEHIIGQERAVRSIEFGVEMPGEQYNIAVVGPPVPRPGNRYGPRYLPG